MAQNKININSDNITEWLASTGFLFPRNEAELDRFNKLYEDFDILISEPNPEKIMNLKAKPLERPILEMKTKQEIDGYRMVARNGNNLPSHIMDKIKKNQDKKIDDTND